MKYRNYLHIAEHWSKILNRANLDNFEAMASEQGEACLRKVPGRITVRLRLNDPENGELTFFLKRYHASGNSCADTESVRRQASHEWRVLRNFGPEVLPCPEPVAVGWGTLDGHATAFLMTKNIDGATQADHLLGRRDGNVPPGLAPVYVERSRMRIIRGIGSLAGRLHAMGWVHRDLYFCHFFPVLSSGGDVQKTYLIDLQRAFTPRPTTFFRWRIKDLAALRFAAWECNIGKHELNALWEAYWNTSKTRAWSRPMLRAAAFLKSLGLRRRDGRKKNAGLGDPRI